MNQSDFFPYTRAVPFRPYRIVLRNGTTYPVHFQDMVMPLKSYAVVLVPNPSRKDRDEDLFRVPMSDIDRIEPLEGEPGSASLARSNLSRDVTQ